MLPRQTLPAVLTALALVLPGCEAEPKRTETPPPAKAAETQETSVKPGINKTFLDPELDVDSFVKRWEVESREIYVHREAILAALKLEPGQAIADIGTGTGLYLKPFADAVGPKGRVYAVDISPRFLAHVRERVKTEALNTVSVVEGGEREARLKPDSVDAAFVCDTYHHFEYPQSMLASLRSALKPNGLLAIIDFERIPGVSSDWVMGHVRAGKATVIKEVEAAGFKLEKEVQGTGLEENYMLRFRKTG